MALSIAVLIAVTIKSAYLSRSLVDRCPEKSADPSASSSVDLNTSLSVWSNLYLVWLVNVFQFGGYLLSFLSVGDRCPSRHPFENEFHVLLNFGEINAISSMSALPFPLSICVCSPLFR